MTTQLFIEGQEVILPTDMKVKVIHENVYFTKSSTYSRDLKLSLHPLINRKIFSNLHRMEVRKHVTSWKARFKVGRFIDLSGSAILLEVSDEFISIQFVADNAELNFLGKSSSKKINELDYEENELMSFPWSGKNGYFTPEEYNSFYGGFNVSAKKEGQTAPYLVKYVYLPTLNENGDYLANRVTSVHKEDFFKRGPFLFNNGFPNAPQPYILWALEMVFKKFGFKLKLDSNKVKLLQNVIICNSTPTNSLNDIMPSWTLNELLEQLELLLNVVFVIDGGVMEAIPATQFYDNVAERVVLKVADAYTTRIDEDEDEDISVTNLTYDLQGVYDPFLKIDSEVYRKATKIECSSHGDMEDKKNALPADERFKVIYLLNGRCWILTRRKGNDTIGEFKEVNQFGDLLRDENSDNYIHLKIVPVKLEEKEIYIYYLWNNGKDTGVVNDKATMLFPSVSQANYSSEDNSGGDLEHIIGGDTSSDSITGKDVIELAINNATKDGYELSEVRSHSGKMVCTYPAVYTDYPQKIGKWEYPKKEDISLRLAHEPGHNSIGAYHLNKYKFDRKVEYEVSFYDKNIPSPRSIFMIRNQEYVAKSIEVDVRADGIAPLKKAKLYRLDGN